MNQKTTEQDSLYDGLDQMATHELLHHINQEDQKVAEVIGQILPSIEAAVDAIYSRMKEGGRLFYMGSGTSGRLGIVDASECPPTFGVPSGWVIGIIAGGEKAIQHAAEFAEDDRDQGWLDLQAERINSMDFVMGLSASGTTPYVLGALQKAKEEGIATGGISCNPQSPLSALADYPIEAVVGPEFVTGSTRMKAGTAQKMILNMISTSLMIRLGRVKGNKMVDMQLSNHKLIERGTKMIVAETGLDYETAKALLLKSGSVRAALLASQK